MINFINKLSFHYTYLIMSLSFILGGYFINIIVLTSLILVHELGHYIIINSFNIDIIKINIYPFGGLIKYHNMINEKISKDLLISLGGIALQSFCYLLITILFNNNIIREYTYNIIKTYHFAILYFNILPIYPLDGFKILNLILNKIFSYKLSNQISIFISIFSIILLTIMLKYNYTYILTISILIKSTITYYNNLKLMFNKFLLERYLYNLKFTKNKIINNPSQMFKEYSHFIKSNNKYQKESLYLKKIFDTNSKI